MASIDINALVPDTVVVYFPKKNNGIPLAAPYTVSISLTDLALSTEFGTFAGFPGEKVLHCSAIASSVGGGAPTNATELGLIATQAATDWYRHQLGKANAAYEGVVPWVMEGLTDEVEFRHDMGLVATIAQRGPWMDQMSNLTINGSAGSAASVSVGGTEWYVDETIVYDGDSSITYNGATINYGTGTITFGSGTSVTFASGSTLIFAGQTWQMTANTTLAIGSGVRWTITGDTAIYFSIPVKFMGYQFWGYADMALGGGLVSDWDQAAHSGNIIWRISSSGTLDGIVPQLNGGFGWQIIALVNDSGGFVVIKDEAGSASSAANRFRLPNHREIQMNPFDSMIMGYNIVNTRWEVLGYTASWAVAGAGNGVLNKLAVWTDENTIDVFTGGTGHLPIGKTDGTWTSTTLTAGSGITITPGDGTITIAASGGGSSPPFSDASALVMNDSDHTKLAILSCATITTGTTRTYVLPDVNGDTFVMLAATQTLTNKTLTAPTETNSTINQFTNSSTALTMNRATDTAPTGNFINMKNAAGTAVFTVDITGNVTVGTWNATVIGVAYGGTGFASYTAGDIIYASGATAFNKVNIGASGTILTSSGTAPQWQTASAAGLSSNAATSYTDTTADAYATIYTDSNSAGIHGSVSIHNTGATKSLRYKITVTNMDSNSTTIINTLTAGAYFFFCCDQTQASTTIGPPYQTIQVELQSAVAGNSTTYKVWKSIVG